MRFVVDASVALKWILPESDSVAAETLLKIENELFAPDLILAEVMGVLLRSVRQSRLAGDATEPAWTLLNAALRLEPARDHILGAYRIAEAADGSVFDAVYASVSRTFGYTLVTADERQLLQASRAGIDALRLSELKIR
jgi:predicted nucleic acid-binding protein